MMNRRTFVGNLSKGAAGVALGLSSLEMIGCTPATALQEVLALLPTVGEIILSIGNVIAAIDPSIGGAISSALKIIGASFTSIQAIIKQYQLNIAGMPATVLNELDAAIAAVASQMTAIEATIPNLNPVVAAAINVALAAFQAILGYLSQILPAPVAAQMFPKAFHKLVERHITMGISVGLIPTPRDFQKSYNQQMKYAGHPEIHIHVDWKYHIIP
jgi:hypothetical protein